MSAASSGVIVGKRSYILVGAIIGAVALYSAPFLSRKLTRLRGEKMVPYQGMLISLATLLVASGLLEVAL